MLKSLVREYGTLFGFSLGGVVLQSLFDWKEMKDKKIVFFSTPSFVDNDLYNKLNEIKKLIINNQIKQAVDLLNHYISFHHQAQLIKLDDEQATGKRLQLGLRMLLNVDNRRILEKSRINYLHLIGQDSTLVNENQVISNKYSSFITVPRSEMHVPPLRY